MRISKVSSAHAQWPVFGEQIAGGIASTRPIVAVRATQRAVIPMAGSLQNLPDAQWKHAATADVQLSVSVGQL